MKHTVLLISTAIAATITISPAIAIPETYKEVADSTEVFSEFIDDPDARVPAALIQKSEAIAIITNVKEGGFVLGGRRGDGVMVSRMANGQWSNPAFVNLSGGSIGFQAGFQASDILLLFPSQTALRQVLSSDFKLGGSISGTAGPIGRSARESLEGFSDDKVYVYSRSEGLFGGVTLEGTKLKFDKKDNRKFYGQYVTPKRIFSDTSLKSPDIVRPFKQTLVKAE